MNPAISISSQGARRRRGSVLVIVMWICLGLVALVLYFANSMSTELRAADNRLNEMAARQAVAAGGRYAAYILTQYGLNGLVPDVANYKAEALPVGDATFWFIGRNPDPSVTTDPYFALIDESSKLNLNTVSSAMLQTLPVPNLTSDLTDAIVAWRSTSSQNNSNVNNVYAQLDPPRMNKGAPFESVDELRLVNGATLDLLLGEDTNRNGYLDPNEDDGDQSAPHDNQDGQLQSGLLEYTTVYSRLPATSASGSRRINLTTLTTPQARQTLANRLTQRGIAAQRAQAIVRNLGTNPVTSVAEFLSRSGITADEFVLVHTDLTATTSTAGTQTGLVNVNTASAAVLGCIPGIGTDNASTMVAYRLAHPDVLTSMAWITQILPRASLVRAGPYITDQSYQFSADIAAVGRNGRGYCRERVVFDTTSGTPRVVYRQDLTSCGWALGADARQNASAPKDQ